jgi:hypothetical protein|tara:strand:+ start:202 stop:390 length:189 start_codon:yes stop_codon:yes gene_type:complete
MKPGDLVKHNKPSSRHEFDQIGLVLELQEDWPIGWSKIKVLWPGAPCAKWSSRIGVKPFTSS